MFYVYKWFVIDTNEVFYIGKGKDRRAQRVTGRNKYFLEYYNNYNCDYEIIKYFEEENDAFNYEKELIAYYQSINQAKANIDKGGKGGHHFAMTEELKAYLSQCTKEHSAEISKRMIEKNPMHNPLIAKKVADKNRKPLIINDKEYSSIGEASKILNIPYQTIYTWCEKGYTPTREQCYFKSDGPKEMPIIGHEVAVLIDGQYFPSISRAAKFLGKKTSSRLAEALRTNKKTYSGHKIEYVNSQPSQENNQ